MAFTYDPTLSDTVSVLRNLIQDIDSTSYDFEDEEILALYAINSNKTYKTASELVLRLSIKYAKAPARVQVDGIQVENNKRGEVYKDLHLIYRNEAKRESLTTGKKGAIHFTGIDRDRFNTVREDTTNVRPRFTRDQIEYSPRYPQTSPLDKDYYVGVVDDGL